MANSSNNYEKKRLSDYAVRQLRKIMKVEQQVSNIFVFNFFISFN